MLLLAYNAGIYHAKIKLYIILQTYKLILTILFATGICSNLAQKQTYRSKLRSMCASM
jgi:hypothetical protein